MEIGYEDDNLNRVSRAITQPKSQGASQAMLHAVGMTPEDLNKAQVGIASTWYQGSSSNVHLLSLADSVKKSVDQDPRLYGFQFNTVGVSDIMSLGKRGMEYSLPSRELIADSIQTTMGAQWYDALVTVPGCDQDLPGCAMATLRMNRPGIVLYGGTVATGKASTGEALDVVSTFEAYGKYVAGAINGETYADIVERACPGAGAYGGMSTSNTMACAIEALGLSLPRSSSMPATSDGKREECSRVARAVKHLLQRDLKPCDIVSRKSFENAIVVVNALGGSTNAVLHLLAMAATAGVELSLEDFQRVGSKIALIADLKPTGTYRLEDIEKIGGFPVVMKYLLKLGCLHGDCLTVTGSTLAENLASFPDLDFKEQDVIRPLEKCISSAGSLKIFSGNICPEGAVAKMTTTTGSFTGRANVFDGEESMLQALEQGKISKGDFIVIRYEGPKGGPGMREMLQPLTALTAAGLSNDVALMTDGRFSGVSQGFIIGHVCPEAFEGGQIALICNGDAITADATTNQLSVDISEEELAKRRAEWKQPGPKFKSGYLRKYIMLVGSASKGCLTDR